MRSPKEIQRAIDLLFGAGEALKSSIDPNILSQMIFTIQALDWTLGGEEAGGLGELIAQLENLRAQLN